MKSTFAAASAAALSLAVIASSQTISVVSSPHDLSAGSVASVRAASEDQVCIFCHTPHNASPIGALWNRSLSPQAYSVYTSRALDAKPGQPTGSSKLCLSCYDGTIALGSVLSQSTPIQMTGGVTTMPAGTSNIGTDLRDDHPISFVYDSSLASKDGRLRDPIGLPHQIKLDSNRELQCTTCHDAHNNAFGDFLVMRNTASEMCISCHQVGRTDIRSHSRCTDCHQSHTAPSGPFLLKQATVDLTCLACHDGDDHEAANIQAEMRKPYNHGSTVMGTRTGDAVVPTNCTSCHDPHTMNHGVASAPNVRSAPVAPSQGRLGRIAGVSVTGAAVPIANSEAEVCFKCHGDSNTTPPAIPRRSGLNNTRLQFSPSAVSMHPVGSPGRGAQVPSLRPGWSTSSVMQCSDCHGSDSGTTAGVHGSTYPMLLTDRYETADYTSESAATYALCYKCHDRGSILDDRSFPGHRRHIVQERTSCAACHDGHGIAGTQGNMAANAHLINFATNVVFPDRVTGKLEYRDTGGFTGECFLSCHGVDHSPKRYPVEAGFGGPGIPALRPPR